MNLSTPSELELQDVLFVQVRLKSKEKENSFKDLGVSFVKEVLLPKS